MKNWILTGVFIGLTTLFVCLKSVWAGFVYFALACLIIICMFWVMQLSFYYYCDYYKNYDDDFKYFKANIVNTKNITSQEFEENIDYYRKMHKKERVYNKIIDIFKILFLLGLIAVAIVVIT